MATTVLRTVASAVAGGTASLLGGGKFANGAFSGAFVYLFNDNIKRLNTYRQNMFKKFKGYCAYYSPNRLKTIYDRKDCIYCINNGKGEIVLAGEYQFIKGTERVLPPPDLGDEIGLGLSVLALANPAGMGLRFSIMAIGVDLLQGDATGVGIGIGAMKYPALAPVDIGYGIWQVVK